MTAYTEHGKLIPFPDDMDEDEALAAAFERQRQIEEIAEAVAQLVYRGKAIWIGGMCLPWPVLSEGQRRGYIQDAKQWIRGE